MTTATLAGFSRSPEESTCIPRDHRIDRCASVHRAAGRAVRRPRQLGSTPFLIGLAILLPMLVLLSAQLGAYCDEQGECFLPVRIMSWLAAPLSWAWLAALAILAIRAGRWMRNRERQP
jgi:hypothetical protein